MSKADIAREVELVKKDHPNAGEVMLLGRLTSRGLRVQSVRTAIYTLSTLMVWTKESASL